jgi:hypothetical protein
MPGERKFTDFAFPAGPYSMPLSVVTWPLTNVFMPATSMSWTCTKTSGSPPSGTMTRGEARSRRGSGKARWREEDYDVLADGIVV